MGHRNKCASDIRTSRSVCVFAVLFISMVAGAPRPHALQPPLEDEYSGQAVGMGLYAVARKPNAVWKQVAPEINSYRTEDKLMVPAPVEVLLLNSDRRKKRQVPESPDVPVEPFSATTEKSDDQATERASSSSSGTSSGTTEAAEVDDDQLGNLTMEDLQELESFYTKAREQILRTHYTRLEAENLKNGKSISSKSLLSADEAEDNAAETSNDS